MPLKKGIFRARRITYNSGPVGKDSIATWNLFMSKENEQYESIIDQYNNAATT